MTAAPFVERLPHPEPDAERPAPSDEGVGHVPAAASLRSPRRGFRSWVASWGTANGQPRGLIALVVGVCALGLAGAQLVAVALGSASGLGGDRVSVALALVV